ncbi:peptidase S9 [Anopheles sinensis]|uniref:Peptidase S9 n=1 Tax=Anopheles sinensis TaxID=74873 RepID=A0A084VJD7_ANOSI|nr:peptidase S9 [Anopheles sinensis]
MCMSGLRTSSTLINRRSRSGHSCRQGSAADDERFTSRYSQALRAGPLSAPAEHTAQLKPFALYAPLHTFTHSITS